MKADDLCRTEILALVHETYSRLSTPGSNPGELFAHADMALSGSELGELVYGPEDAQDLAMRAVSLGLTWICEQVTVWREGDGAWAQILGSIKMPHQDDDRQVPYWNISVFARDEEGWHWRYWGGSEPQKSSNESSIK